MKKLIFATLLGFLFSLTPALSHAAALPSPKAQAESHSTKHAKKTAHHQKKHEAKKAKKHAKTKLEKPI